MLLTSFDHMQLHSTQGFDGDLSAHLRAFSVKLQRLRNGHWRVYQCHQPLHIATMVEQLPITLPKS